MKTINYKENEITLTEGGVFFNGAFVKVINNKTCTYKLNKTCIGAQGGAKGLFQFMNECINDNFGLIWIDAITEKMQDLADNVKANAPDFVECNNKPEMRQALEKAFCTNHNGKMAGVVSISTSVVLNPRCQARAKDPNSICHFCFAAAMLDQYSDLEKKLARNTEILTSRELAPEEIPVINADKWPLLRFESFGDLNNVIQVYNYFLIAAVNHKQRAALWTKNPDIIAEAMRVYGIEKPKNLVIIYSSPKVNTPAAEILEKYDFIDKVFTVYDPEYIESCGVKINCGARDCRKCGRCYTKRTGAAVSEKLK